MISLSMRVLTWQQYTQYVRKYIAFSNKEIWQMVGLSVFIFLLYFMYQTQRYGWRVSAIRIPRKVLIAVWTTFIIGMTMINRHGYASKAMLFNPMISINSALSGSAFSQYQVISNVLIYIPYGLLIPWNIWYCRRWWWCAVVCTGTSLMIELEQRITGRGTFDVADLFMNLLGAMIGFLIYAICEKVRHLRRTQKDE